jgi:CRP-like cAMP-binding protein
MPTSITGTLNAAVMIPVQLLRALTDLPRMLEQHARLTDELLRTSQEQLALMREQAEALLVQMREIGEVAVALRAALAELERVNDQLTRIVAESGRAPRRGERFGGLFRRGQREAGEPA